jgi:putative addiction module killer protein
MLLGGIVSYELQQLMVEVRQTEEFSGWLRRLRDANAVAHIVGRIRRMEMGNPGDTRSGGQGILEIRVDYGPVPDLPCASRCAGCNSVVWGDKRTQRRDIKRAEKLAETL